MTTSCLNTASHWTMARPAHDGGIADPGFDSRWHALYQAAASFANSGQSLVHADE
jgi:hypothetical protein